MDSYQRSHHSEAERRLQSGGFLAAADAKNLATVPTVPGAGRRWWAVGGGLSCDPDLEQRLCPAGLRRFSLLVPLRAGSSAGGAGGEGGGLRADRTASEC